MMAPVVLQAPQRNGHRFQPVAERALDSVTEQLIQSLPHARDGILAIREMQGPRGIPDLTVLTRYEDRVKLRLDSGVPPLLNEIDAAIVSRLYPRRPKSLPTVATELGWPLDTIERRAQILTKQGATAKLRTGTYVRDASLVPLGDIVAVEQKVQNYKAALRQARMYSMWADNYAIVMLSLSEFGCQYLQKEISQDAGGLAVADNWKIMPKVGRKHTSDRRLWASEHLVAALMGG